MLFLSPNGHTTRLAAHGRPFRVRISRASATLARLPRVRFLRRKRVRSYDPGGRRLTRSFPAIGDLGGRPSLATGLLEKPRQFRFGKLSKFVQCFRRVRALESPEKMEELAKATSGNLAEKLGKPLHITDIATYLDEFLLKACASRQEKLSFCHKNSAASDADIGNVRRISRCRQE